MFFDDEGTYASQAWSVTHLRALAPYTYWYDHPPLGWLVLSAALEPFARMAGVNGSLEEARAWGPHDSACSQSRPSWSMRWLEASGCADSLQVWPCFCLRFPPLSLHFQRMVLLDNLATPFVRSGLRARRDTPLRPLVASRRSNLPRLGSPRKANRSRLLAGDRAAGMAIIAAQHAPLRHSRRSIPLHPDLPRPPALCPPERRADPGIGPRQPLRGAALATL